MNKFMKITSTVAFAVASLGLDTIEPSEPVTSELLQVTHHRFYIGDYLNEQAERERVAQERAEAVRREQERVQYETEMRRREQEEERKRAEYSYDSLNTFFADTGFAGRAESFINVAQEFNVPVDLLVSISAHETGWGRSTLFTSHNNPGGIRCTERADYCVDGFSGYNSLYTGLADKAYLLRTYYLDRGLDTLSTIQPVYCPLSDGGCDVWYSNISRIIESVREYVYVG